MDEDQRKHLDYIQAIITRMNTNSFQIKGTAITIISALLAVFASTQKIIFILVSCFPLVIFWFLDSYYLQQERKFRGLYNDVAGITNKNKIRIYDMPIQLYIKDKYSFMSSFVSKTIAPMYFLIVLTLVASCIILECNGFKYF